MVLDPSALTCLQMNMATCHLCTTGQHEKHDILNNETVAVGDINCAVIVSNCLLLSFDFLKN